MKDLRNKNSLCHNYKSDKYYGLILNNFVTVMVAVINIIIRTINMKLIDFIGYSTDSKRVSLIMVSVFIAQMINTGVIVILTNANL